MFICLSGPVLSGLSLNSWHDMDAYFETSSEAPELETAAILPPRIDKAVTLLDTNVSSATLPAGKLFFLSACSWTKIFLMTEIVLSCSIHTLD